MIPHFRRELYSLFYGYDIMVKIFMKKVLMRFDPKTNRFPYPEQTDCHYLSVKKDDKTVFDENYPYVDNSKSAKFKRGLIRILLYTVVFPITTLRLDLRIKGRENIKKYKDVLKNGVISVANHVHMWDYLAIMKGVRPYKTNILAWAPNIRGENGKMIRGVGGIPIPTDNMKGLNASVNMTKKLLEDKGWLHIYAEGSMWEFYAPIRPFKTGAAYYSLKTGKPVLPMAFSYRKSGPIRKLLNSPAAFTLNIGEPIFPDTDLPFKEAERALTVKYHDAVCRLAGIDPEENIYPPLFNNSKRVDYYTNEYGIGYKGSF